MSAQIKPKKWMIISGDPLLNVTYFSGIYEIFKSLLIIDLKVIEVKYFTERKMKTERQIWTRSINGFEMKMKNVWPRLKHLELNLKEKNKSSEISSSKVGFTILRCNEIHRNVNVKK